MKLITVIFITVIFLVTFTHCSSAQEDVLESTNDYVHPWVGEYDFFEFIASPVGSDLSMGYRITIYEERGVYYAEVIIDGFQTMLRARALVQGNHDSVDLIFNSYLPDNLSERFNQGDILLTFERTGVEVITKWGSIQPLIPDNEKPGLHFTRLQE